MNLDENVHHGKYEWTCIIIGIFQNVYIFSHIHTFTHTQDALIGYFQCYILVSAIDLGSTYFALTVIVLYYMTSFMMIWEDYVTDEMRFGKYNSPTEAIMLAISILIATFVMGQSKWSTVLFTIQQHQNSSSTFYWLFKIFSSDLNATTKTTSQSSQQFLNIQFNTLMVSIATLLGASIIVSNIRSVLGFASHSARKRSHRTIHVIGGIGGALKGILSYMIVLVMFVVLAFLSPHLVENHFLPLSMLYGLTASYIQTRLIFARVCGCLSPTFFFIMIPMGVLLVERVFVVMMMNSSTNSTNSNSTTSMTNTNSMMEVYLLYGCVGVVIFSYLHMAILVIRQICDTLNIHAFRVKKVLIE